MKYILTIIVLLGVVGCVNEPKSKTHNKGAIHQRIVFPFIGEDGEWEDVYWSSDLTPEGTFKLTKENKTLLVTNGSHKPSSLYFHGNHYFVDMRTNILYVSDGTNSKTKVYKKLDNIIDELFSSNNRLCYAITPNVYCMQNGSFTKTSDRYEEQNGYKIKENNNKLMKNSDILFYHNGYYYLGKDGFVYQTSPHKITQITKQHPIKKSDKDGIGLLKVIDNALLYAIGHVIKESSCREKGIFKEKLYYIDLTTEKVEMLKEIKIETPLLLC